VIPESAQKIAETRNVQIKVDVENTPVFTDEKLLRNVVRRLLHNAAKFADPDTEVLIKGYPTGDLFQVQISNKGPEMSEAKIRQILKPFKLNENALNHSTGTGLGLSICQALLKLLGSQLDITCTDGTVTVSFGLRTQIK
jgi:K+-sensing histidine kinase KdpD